MLKKTNTLHLLQAVLGILLFAYVLYRALRLGITYDEAWTLNEFVPLSIRDILNCTPCDANNHLLNTLLIKCFYFLGFKGIFAARIPNILAFLFFLLYAFRISKLLPPFSGITVFVLLLCNPFLLDFFSLARGYGLGLSFQVASVYYLLCFCRDKHIKHSIYALLLASLAVLSNFSQLNYWAALLPVLLFVGYTSPGISKKKFILCLSLPVIFLALIIFKPVRNLVNTGSLYYGGDHNFYSDTLLSLTKYTQYSSEINKITAASLNIFLLIVGAGIFILLSRNIKNKFKSLTPENSLFLLLFFSVLSSIALHYLLGTLYLIDRTALFYYPLFILLLCFSFNLGGKILRNITFSFLLAFFSFNFFLNANRYKTATSFFDAPIPEILDYINKLGAKENKKMKLDFSWPFMGSVYYYCEKEKLYPFVRPVPDKTEKEKVATDADYYIFLGQTLQKVGYATEVQEILSLKKDTALSFPKESVYVFTNIVSR